MVLHSGFAVVLRPCGTNPTSVVGHTFFMHTQGLLASDVHKASDNFEREIQWGVRQNGKQDANLSGNTAGNFDAGRVLVMAHTHAVVYRLVNKVWVLVVSKASGSPLLARALADGVTKVLVAVVGGSPSDVTFKALLPEYARLYLAVRAILNSQGAADANAALVSAEPTLGLWLAKDAKEGAAAAAKLAKKRVRHGVTTGPGQPASPQAETKGRLHSERSSLSRFACALPTDSPSVRPDEEAEAAAASPPPQDLLGGEDELDQLFAETTDADNPFAAEAEAEAKKKAEEEAAKKAAEEAAEKERLAREAILPADGSFPAVLKLHEIWHADMAGARVTRCGLLGQVQVDTRKAQAAMAAAGCGMPDLYMRFDPTDQGMRGASARQHALVKRALGMAQMRGGGVMATADSCPPDERKGLVMRPAHAAGLKIDPATGHAVLLRYSLPAAALPPPLLARLSVGPATSEDARLAGKAVHVLSAEFVVSPALPTDVVGALDVVLPEHATAWGTSPKEPKPFYDMANRVVRFRVGPTRPGETAKVSVLVSTAPGKTSEAALQDARGEFELWGRPGTGASGIRLAEAATGTTKWKLAPERHTCKFVVKASLAQSTT